MPSFANNSYCPGRFHDYVIAGNTCNAFCIGEIGSEDDFFLIGCEPEPDSNFPMLTGNILSSEGEKLFSIVRNVLKNEHGLYSKVISNRVGYEIHDVNGKKILGVETVCFPENWHPDSKWKTTIYGQFHNKNGQLVFSANSGAEDERIESQSKHAFGYNRGGFSHIWNLSSDELMLALVALERRGTIYQIMRGDFVNEEIELDGKLLVDVNFDSCHIHVRSADFVLLGGTIQNCRVDFHDDYARLRNMVLALERTKRVSA